MNRDHLTLENRQVIEQMLNSGQYPVEIAKVLGKHLSTICREIKTRSITKRSSDRAFHYRVAPVPSGQPWGSRQGYQSHHSA